ncbi:MAG: hypothetical protein ACKOA8_19335 [Deltaproteobacteria bacterium]
MSIPIISSFQVVILALSLGISGAQVALASSGNPTQGCAIPESGPQKGILPAGCSEEPKVSASVFKESQVRCRVLDVKCDPKIQGGYIAVAQVEQWLKGAGPKQIEFKFSKKRLKANGSALESEAGRGLCADLTLERKASDWLLKKIDNPTSSSDVLPSCP